MANKAKYLFFSSCFIVGGLLGYTCHASLPSISDELYSDSLYSEKNAPAPQAFESSGREAQLAANDTTVTSTMSSASTPSDTAIESMNDSDNAAATPAEAPAKKKHSKKKVKH